MAAKRRLNLAELVPPADETAGQQANPGEQTAEPLPAPAAATHDGDRAETTEPATAPDATVGQRAAAATAGAGNRPRWETFERKEARLRADQVDALDVLTRRLNRARHGTGERITQNTLIRVAVDLLLARTDTIAGTTEDEVRNSVSP